MFKKTIVVGVALAILLASTGLFGQNYTATSAAVPESQHVSHRNNCELLFSRAQFKHYATNVFRRKTITKRASTRVSLLIRCQHSDKNEQWAKAKRAHLAHLRWIRLHPWQFRFQHLSAADRAWAIRTGACESGNNPRRHSSHGDHGAMQFKLSTAWAAGFTRDPHLTSIHEQWVRGVWWRNRAGRGQWPNCG